MCKHFVCTHKNSCFLFPYILDCFYVLNHFEQVKKKKKKPNMLFTLIMYLAKILVPAGEFD